MTKEEIVIKLAYYYRMKSESALQDVDKKIDELETTLLMVLQSGEKSIEDAIERSR